VKDAPKGCRFNVLVSKPQAETDANTPSSLAHASKANYYQFFVYAATNNFSARGLNSVIPTSKNFETNVYFIASPSRYL